MRVQAFLVDWLAADIEPELGLIRITMRISQDQQY